MIFVPVIIILLVVGVFSTCETMSPLKVLHCCLVISFPWQTLPLHRWAQLCLFVCGSSGWILGVQFWCLGFGQKMALMSQNLMQLLLMLCQLQQHCCCG